MKVAYFTDCFTPWNNGVVVSINTFLEGLKKYNLDLLLVAPEYKGYSESSENLIRVPGILRYGYSLHCKFSPEIEEKIAEYDIFHIHHMPFSFLGEKNIANRAFNFAKAKGKKIVLHNHTRYDLYALAYFPLFNLRKEFVKRKFLEKNIYFCNQADAVISPSDSLKEFLIGNGLKAYSETIPTPVSLERFKNGDRERIRKKYNISENEFLFLYIGRISEDKNISALARAVEDFPPEFGIKSIFVGEGNKHKSLEKKLKGVIFTGAVPHEDIPDYYAAADAFGTMSYSEAQGIVYWEAKAAGKPIIALDAIGARDVVHKENGFLVKSEQNFRDCLITFARTPKLRKEISENAMKKSFETCKEDYIEKMYNLYCKLIEK